MLPAVSPDVRGAYFGSLDRAFEGFTFVDDSAASLMQSAMGNMAGMSGVSGMSMAGSHRSSGYMGRSLSRK